MKDCQASSNGNSDLYAVNEDNATQRASVHLLEKASLQSLLKRLPGKVTSDSLASLVHQVRREVLAEMDDDSDLFDGRDLEKVRGDDLFVERFVLSQNNPKDAVNALVQTLIWRKNNRINEELELEIPREFWETGIILLGEDAEGTLVGYFRVRLYQDSVGQEWADLGKMALDLIIKKMDTWSEGRQFAVVVDMRGAGLSNCSVSLTKQFLATVFNHYPLLVKYIWLFEPPWFMRSLLSAFVHLMPLKYRKITRVIDRITGQQIMGQAFPAILGGEATVKMVIPAASPSLEDVAQSNAFSKTKVQVFKRFYAKNESIMKIEAGFFVKTFI